jgi:hypothetical protein
MAMTAAPASATFERDGLVVTATFLGARRWTVVTSGGAASTREVDNGTVSGAIWEALRLSASLPWGTRLEVRAEHIRHGVISNNTHPPTDWWFDVDPGAGGVAPDVVAAIWQCLTALHLSPRVARERSPLVDPRFGLAALSAAAQPETWASELARAAQAWLGADASIEDTYDLMHELRALGHPIYSFDESEDFVLWTTWGPERPPRRLGVRVSLPPYEPPIVTVTVPDA